MSILKRMYDFCYYLSQKLTIEILIFIDKMIIKNFHGTNPDNLLGK